MRARRFGYAYGFGLGTNEMGQYSSQFQSASSFPLFSELELEQEDFVRCRAYQYVSILHILVHHVVHIRMPPV